MSGRCDGRPADNVGSRGPCSCNRCRGRADEERHRAPRSSTPPPALSLPARRPLARELPSSHVNSAAPTRAPGKCRRSRSTVSGCGIGIPVIGRVRRESPLRPLRSAGECVNTHLRAGSNSGAGVNTPSLLPPPVPSASGSASDSNRMGVDRCPGRRARHQCGWLPEGSATGTRARDRRPGSAGVPRYQSVADGATHIPEVVADLVGVPLHDVEGADRACLGVGGRHVMRCLECCSPPGVGRGDECDQSHDR